MRRCGFIGNGINSKLEKKIYEEIKKLIQEGITEFYSTGASEFHDFCENAAIKHGGKVILVPYAEKYIKNRDLSHYSGIICLFYDYPDESVSKTDEWIIENCDVFLCGKGENLIEWDKDKINRAIN